MELMKLGLLILTGSLIFMFCMYGGIVGVVASIGIATILYAVLKETSL